jgi:hypothetical protein
MARRAATIDPAANAVAAEVLRAFRSARAAGRPSVACYRAGVEAWQRAYPDQSAEYAAKQAVAVILAADVKFRIEE